MLRALLAAGEEWPSTHPCLVQSLWAASLCCQDRVLEPHILLVSLGQSSVQVKVYLAVLETSWSQSDLVMPQWRRLSCLCSYHEAGYLADCHCQRQEDKKVSLAPN